MRKTLLSLTALAGLFAAGVATSASAAPAQVAVAPIAAPAQATDHGLYQQADWRWHHHRRWWHHRHYWHRHW